MRIRALAAVGLLGIAAATVACTSTPSNEGDQGSIKSRTEWLYELRLADIRCVDGKVTAHFELLHVDIDDTPGPLTGTSNQGPFTANDPVKVGDVWHYYVTLQPGTVAILSANMWEAVLVNPGAYSGEYSCEAPPPEKPCPPKTPPPPPPPPPAEECPDNVDAGSFCSAPFGKPEDECAKLGLVWTGVKDETGGEGGVTATTSAYAAIVKGGSGGAMSDAACSEGESSYRVYVNVKAGDSLETGNGTGVSHVTYCGCPPAK